ncbi:MAG: histidine kinase [Bacteroidales bacterium]|nr:histidine kinase [Bacteroidales bacterium]MBQ9713148.1 histidine kinase [Bacteroidales bacterium]
MNFIERLDITMKKRPWLASLILAAIAIYPQLVSIVMEWKMYSEYGKPFQYFAITPVRFLLFFAAALACLLVNFRTLKTKSLWNYAKWDFLICLAVIPLFYILVKGLKLHVFQFSMIYFEALMLWIFVVGLSYMDTLLESQRKTEKENEQLQMESMKSRYAALLNQINPHFFFNSLNGLSSLVRKKDENATLQYIEDISDIFRYTLQNEPLDLVPMESEVDFAKQYVNVLKTRYAHKLTCTVDVKGDSAEDRLPVLTMLPLLENITTHNIIDSEHPMEISIRTTEDGFLEVSNLSYPKPNPPKTGGTGLKNLSSRFQILSGKEIEIKDDGHTFTVRLPIIKE